MVRRVLFFAVLGLLVIFGAIQLVPYGRDHTNPPVTREAPWGDADARAIARKACYDCHSNETHWRWYANVAPVSWLNQRDVQTGRQRMNFSEWDTFAGAGAEAADVVREGEMPPWFYWIIHWDARLSQQEKDTLAKALEQLP